MVFNTTFNNISAISWQSVLLVEEIGVHGGKPQTCLKSLTNFITYYCIEYTSPWTGFELTTLVMIGTDCTCSWISNYHIITNTTVPTNKWGTDIIKFLIPPKWWCHVACTIQWPDWIHSKFIYIKRNNFGLLPPPKSDPFGAQLTDTQFSRLDLASLMYLT